MTPNDMRVFAAKMRAKRDALRHDGRPLTDQKAKVIGLFGITQGELEEWANEVELMEYTE